jgi:hypothetical protein
MRPKGGSGGETTTSNEPPAHLQKPLKQFGNVLAYGNQNPDVDMPNYWQGYNPEFFGGRTFALPGENLTNNMNLYAQSGNDPTGNLAQSEQYNQDVLGGKYLGLSQPMQNAVMNPVMDQTAGRFEAMGRYGGPASQQSVNAAGMSALMPYFDQERQRQGQAAAMLPAIDEQRLARATTPGQFFMGLQQQGIDEQMARHNFGENQYLDRMQNLAGLLGTGGGYSTQTSQLPGGSPVSAGLGGAAMGAALAGASNGAITGPWGAAIGAGLGLLGHYV